MKRTIYLLVCTLLSVRLFAQEKPIQSFSLKQAVEFAKKNNYALKNNQLDVLAAQKKVKEILSSGLPQVSATGNFINNTTIATQVLPNFLKPTFVQLGLPGANELSDFIPAQFGQKFSATGSISASQLLFDGGFLMGVKAAKEYVALAEINVNRGNIETEVNVSKAYYAVLLLQTNVKLLTTNLETLTKAKGDMEKLYKAGLVEKTDFDRITLQQSTIDVTRSKIADQQRIASMILKLQLGMNVNDSILLTDDLQKMFTSVQTVAVESKADYNKRTEYQLLNQSIKLNTLDKKRYQYEYAPSLVAIAATQRNTFGSNFSDLGNTWFPGTYWGLNLSIPIFDGLRKSAQIQQSKINITKAENDKKTMENVIEQQVLQSKLTFLRTGEQLAIQEKNMTLAQDIYDRVQLKYKNGVGSSLELTISQNDLETARTNYLSTVYDYFVAQLELRKAMGDIK
jgi:outer membrane protein TolC